MRMGSSSSHNNMAALIRQVGEFVEGQEEWSQYAEIVDHYYAANDVTEAEKKGIVSFSDWP